jgi:predicted extracellular nuclease
VNLQNLFCLFLAVPLVALGDGASGSGVVSITNGAPYIQTFDTLAASGATSTLLPPGWYLRELGSGTAADGAYAIGNGSGNAGGAYSFGSAASTERALGSVGSGTVTPIFYGARFSNDTGSTITALAIAYTGEQWRVGGATGDGLTIAYSLDATDLATGTFTPVASLKFASPLPGCSGTGNGNTDACRKTMNAGITGLAIPPGSAFWIRWEDVDSPGADDGLAIDDFSLTASIAVAAPTNPTATAAANPSTVSPGQSTLLNGKIIPGTLPPSQSYAVTCDLGSVGGSAAQDLPVSGTSFRLSLTPAPRTAPGDYALRCIVRDDQGRSSSFAIALTIDTPFTCGSPAIPISQVQGPGATSPLGGQPVEIEGIVVGAFQNTSTQLGGYFLEEPAATQDADPATSEGIFVFSNGAGPAVNHGDRVRVRGTVAEFGSSGSTLTEIQSVAQSIVCSTGNPLPEAVDITLPVSSTADLERYEGMLVQFSQPLVVTGSFNLGTFGQIDLAPSVLYQPTQTPGNVATWAAAADLNSRSKIALDDGSALANTTAAQNLYPTLFPEGGLAAANTLRIGARVNETGAGVVPLTGVLDQRFGSYRLQPTGKVTFSNASNPRPDAAAVAGAVGSRIRVASANVLNFFITLGKRGAATQAELNRQRAKITAELSKLNADIYGLSEVQNFENGNTNGVVYTNKALLCPSPCAPGAEGLVDALRSATGRNYQFIDTINPGTVASGNTTGNGTDAIRNVMIYDPARVTPIGKAALYYQNDTNRPSLAQTFQPSSGRAADSQTFTVVVNHFRSKSTGCGAGDDPYQGGCNGLRLAMANAVRNWLATNPTGDPSASPKVLLLGDFNAYFGEDPIQALGAGGYTDLIHLLIGPLASSYNFGSQSGYLDHALVNANLLPLVKSVAEVHINADEPAALLALDTNVKPAAAIESWYSPDEFAASDHDPIVIGLNPLAGDFTDDGNLDFSDRDVLVTAYGKAASEVDRRLDLDADGVITPNDYRLWLGLYRAFSSQAR